MRSSNALFIGTHKSVAQEECFVCMEDHSALKFYFFCRVTIHQVKLRDESAFNGDSIKEVQCSGHKDLFASNNTAYVEQTIALQFGL